MRNDVTRAAELQALAGTVSDRGNFEAVARACERALQLAPNDAGLVYDLAAAYHSLKNNERARVLYERAIALNPGASGAYNDLGILCREMGDFDRACEMFSAAARRDPDNATIASNLGGSYLERGQLPEARGAYQHAVSLAPHNGQYLYQLAEVAPCVQGDPRLGRMLDLLKAESSLEGNDRIGLHFALGKGLADSGQHAAAFDQYRIGNELKRAQIDYDETVVQFQMNEIADAFSAPLLEQLQRCGADSDTPIFVVGMLRSGSTLIKQILTSHPSVEAAGEVSYFEEAVSGVISRRPARPRHLRAFIETLSRQEIDELAGRYLTKLRSRAGGALRIVDKALTNFRSVGLIRAVFPKAKIVHTVRSPLDTCWSCYSKLFAEAQPFAYDLGELGRYYNAYRAVMRRWGDLVSRNSMMEICYEELVGDFESTCRRLIEFCELPWDDKCLSFHKAGGFVRTSSAVQVRQPLFRDGVGRSAPFVPHLTPLIRALDLSVG